MFYKDAKNYSYFAGGQLVEIINGQELRRSFSKADLLQLTKQEKTGAVRVASLIGRDVRRELEKWIASGY